MQALLQRVKDESRAAMTSAENDEFTRMSNEFNDLTSQIEGSTSLNEAEGRVNEIRTLFEGQARRQSSDERRGNQGVTEEARERAFDAFARRGFLGIGEDERRALEFVRMESRAQTTSPDSAGGYLVPETYANEIYKFLKYFGGPLEAGKIITTRSGAPWNMPTIDDTSNEGALIAEGVADSFQDVTVGNFTLGAYTLTSKGIKVSYELLDDDDFNLQGHISEIAGTRIGRKLIGLLTTGTGSGQPQGIVTGSTAGETAGASTLTRENLLDLKGSVDFAYWQGPKVGWMFNQSTLLALQKLTIGASDDRPLWQPSMIVGQPDRIEGYPYWINNSMANIGTTNKSVLFGDFSQYYIRQVKGIVMQRASERYIEERVVAFFAYMRFDAKLANTAAVKHIVHA
jgi:HK97 family phage major capsid protein